MGLFTKLFGFLDVRHVAAVDFAEVGPLAFHAIVQAAAGRIEKHHKAAYRERHQSQVDPAESRFPGRTRHRRYKVVALQEKTD